MYYNNSFQILGVKNIEWYVRPAWPAHPSEGENRQEPPRETMNCTTAGFGCSVLRTLHTGTIIDYSSIFNNSLLHSKMEGANNSNFYVQMSESQLSSGYPDVTTGLHSPSSSTNESRLSSTMNPPPTRSTNIISGPSPSKDSFLENMPLTQMEILQLRTLLSKTNGGDLSSLLTTPSQDSEYPAFRESTHAWAVFADNPQKRAGPWERLVGTIIILFQLFAYRLFAAEAIEDFQEGRVPIMVSHQSCLDMDQAPYENFECEAEFTNAADAFVAFIMLGIFLAHDMLQAAEAIRYARGAMPILFALVAGVEVMCAFLSASIAVSYHLFIGEVTDAVEVGVGLLFIRELSQQTYHGIGSGKTKQFRNFFLMVMVLVTVGMILDPLTAKVFAGYVQ
jgi:hypothetical protein